MPHTTNPIHTWRPHDSQPSHHARFSLDGHYQRHRKRQGLGRPREHSAQLRALHDADLRRPQQRLHRHQLDLRQVLRAVGSASSVADLNGDSVVNGIDVDMIAAQLGFTCSDRLMGDVNGDGIVSTADIQAALGSVGTNAPVHDADGNGAVNGTDLQLIQTNLSATIASRILGDADGSGEVTSADLTVGLAQLDQQGSADCDGDGLVTETDLEMIEARMGANTTSALPGDLNGDRIVDGADQGLIEATLGASWDRADADGDGVVGSADLIGLLGLLGDSTAQVLLGDITGDGLVDSTDLNVAAYLLSSDDAVADIDGSGCRRNLRHSGNSAGVLRNLRRQPAGRCGRNRSVGGEDVALIEATMGSDWAQADVTGDGAVTTSDLISTLSNIGSTCQ